jgi:hypothetical protein
LVAQREIPVSFHLDPCTVEKVRFLSAEPVVMTGSADYLKGGEWHPPGLFDQIALELEKLHDRVTFASTAAELRLESRFVIGRRLRRPSASHIHHLYAFSTSLQSSKHRRR